MSHPKLFLVDGLADEREMYAEYLALKGFDVRAFARPQAAIDDLAPEAPAAIVTRLRQPGAIDGIALTALARAAGATREAAIVVITTSTLRSVHDAAFRAGCDACLVLPVTPDDLLREVHSALRSRRSAASSRADVSG